MVPSAHDRLISQSMQQWTPGPPAAERAIEEAYRDGFAAGVQAERARIIAALREPSGELVSVILSAECLVSCQDAACLRIAECRFKSNTVAPDEIATIAGLRALADHLEHQTTTPAHPGGS